MKYKKITAIFILFLGVVTFIYYTTTVQYKQELQENTLKKKNSIPKIEQKTNLSIDNQEQETTKIKKNTNLQQNVKREVITSNHEEKIDNSLEDARLALEKAENTLEYNDYMKAKTLVEKVQDEKLVTRLQLLSDVLELKNNMIQLIDMVHLATDKEDIEKARQYEEKNQLIFSVEQLKHKRQKELLSNLLNQIIEILNDKQDPKILGITQNMITNKKVKWSIQDETSTDIQIYKNGFPVKLQDCYEEEGVYQIVVRDEARNQSIKEFTIDKTNPVIEIEKSRTHLTNQPVIVTLRANEVIQKVEGFEKVDDSTYQKEYTENKLEQVVIQDRAGNQTEIEINISNIDKEKAVISVEKSNQDKATNQDVIVTLTSNKDITVEDFQRVNSKTYQKSYSQNGKYKVIARDKAGNETVVQFEVKRIDKIAPTAKVIVKNHDTPSFEDVEVRVISDEAIYTPKGFEKVESNKEHEYKKLYSENGTYQLTIVDKAGNEKVLTYEVKNIDKDIPNLIVKDPNKYILKAGSEYIDKGYSATVRGIDITNRVEISYLFLKEGTSNWTSTDILDTNKIGVYKLTYQVTYKGNTVKKTRVVEIQE